MIQMSHQGYEDSTERCQHMNMKCFSGDCDALDWVYQVDEEHKAWKDVTERSGCNAHKQLGHREKEERDMELK